MKNNVEKFWHYWEIYGIFGILLIAALVFLGLDISMLGKLTIMSSSNLITVLSRSAIVAIAACGMTFAICSGGFDLSVGAILSLSTCVFASLIPTMGMMPALLITLVVGTVIGIINGFVITKFKMQTFVGTLAMGMIIKGVALLYTSGSKQMLDRNANPEVKFFSQNFDVFGMQVQLMPIVLTVLIFVIAMFVYKYTKFGVFCRSVGSNDPASRTSGIKVDTVLISVFAITALTATISGVIRTSQLMQGHAQLGDGFELEAITATILGGTSLAGGKGNIPGTLIGAILLTLVRSGLNILGLNDEYQRLAIGVILLLSLSINGIRELTRGTEA